MTDEKKPTTRKTTTEATKKAATPRKPAAKKTTATKTSGATKAGTSSKSTTQASGKDTASMVKIDGNNYPLDALNDNAKAQIGNLRATDRHIEELEAELAIAKTARGSYASVLERELKALDKKTLQ